MAVTVTFDTMDSASMRRSVRNGDEIIRTAIVEGLDATLDGHRRMLDAITAPGMPRPGWDYHPTLGGLLCTDIEGQPLPNSPTKALVTMTYGPPEYNQPPQPSPEDPPVFRMTSVLTSIVTRRDRRGAPITLHHVWDRVDENGVLIQDPETGEPQEIDREQIAELEYLRPEHTFTWTRTETRSPARTAEFYIGTVNAQEWGGHAAGTVLCTNIEAETADRGTTWVVTYSFHYKPGGWLGVAGFVDHETGYWAPGVGGDPVPMRNRQGQLNPPAKLMSVELYEERKFSYLRLLGEGSGGPRRQLAGGRGLASDEAPAPDYGQGGGTPAAAASSGGETP